MRSAAHAHNSPYPGTHSHRHARHDTHASTSSGTYPCTHNYPSHTYPCSDGCANSEADSLTSTWTHAYALTYPGSHTSTCAYAYAGAYAGVHTACNPGTHAYANPGTYSRTHS